MGVAMKGLLCMLIVLLLAPSAACSAGGLAAPQSPGDSLIAAQWDTAQAASNRGDHDLVLMALEPAMQEAVYKQLSPSKQREVAQLYAFAAGQKGLWSQAHMALVRLTSDPSTDDMYWGERWHAAMQIGDADDAMALLPSLGRAPRIRAQPDGLDRHHGVPTPGEPGA
jgi:hypothetical protein